MPVKWKIFFALNFVLSLPAFVFLLLLVVQFFTRPHASRDDLYVSIVCLGLSLITVNGFLNIYILQRYFPDKLMPARAKSLSIVSTILNVIVSIGLLVLCIFAAQLEFGDKDYTGDMTGKIALGILSLEWIIQVIVLVMQARLPYLITRNHREKMHSLIDSIGDVEAN